MARDSTEVAHTPSACTTRPPMSCGKVVASAQIALPATKMARPDNTSHLRPNRSDSGPTKSWPTAKATKKLLSVALRSSTDVPRSAAMSGKAGRMMLVASAPSAARPATDQNRR